MKPQTPDGFLRVVICPDCGVKILATFRRVLHMYLSVNPRHHALHAVVQK